jgi:NADH:ubiquinone oxidoreductase subunit H
LPLSEKEFKSETQYSLVLIIALSSFAIVATLMAGYFSNSKYSFIGAIRSIAQMVSYEISFGIIIMSVIIFSNFSTSQIINEQIYSCNNIFPLLIPFVLLTISLIAETNRAPFDLVEGESELVSGFNTEYCGIQFALLFLGEYGHILFSSLFIVYIFVYKSYVASFFSLVLLIKFLIIVFFFV